MKTIDKYIFQALDNYPYCLEDTIESLDYALSYDAKNTIALCLYGRIYAEQLSDYETAKQYFQEVLGVNIHALEVYVHYIQTLLLNEDYKEAQKLIEFALTIKGINKAEILLTKVLLLERTTTPKMALKLLKKVKLAHFSNQTYEIDEVEKRLKTKKELLSGKKPKKEDDGKAKRKGKKK